MQPGTSGQETQPQVVQPSHASSTIKPQLESLSSLLEAETRKKSMFQSNDMEGRIEPFTPAHPHLKLLIKLVFELLSQDLPPTADKYEGTWNNMLRHSDLRQSQDVPDFAVQFARDSKTVVSSKEKIVSVIIFKISDRELKHFVGAVLGRLATTYEECLKTLERIDALNLVVESKILTTYKEFVEKNRQNRYPDRESDPKHRDKPKVSEFTIADVPAVTLATSELVLTEAHHHGRNQSEQNRAPKITIGVLESNYPKNKDWVKPSEALLKDKFTRLLQNKPHYNRPDLVAKVAHDKKVCLGCRKDLDGITKYVVHGL